MANYTTSADLKADVLFRAGERTDGTSDFDAAAMDYLNRAYQAVWMGGGEFEPRINENWWWLLTSGSLLLETALKDVGASVTQGSTSVTLDSAPGKDVAGYHFRVKGHQDVFVVASHGSGTGLTLDEPYTGETDSDATVTVMKLDYELANDVLRLTDPLEVPKAKNGKAYVLDRQSFTERYPLDRLNGRVPDRYTVIGERSVRFNGFVEDERARVNYWYLREPADLEDDANEPLVPRQYRKTLADIALMFLLFDKNDDRASSMGKMGRSGLRAMARENATRWGRQSIRQVIRPRLPRGEGRRRLVTQDEEIIIR